jgi:hypothetical protein
VVSLEKFGDGIYYLIFFEFIDNDSKNLNRAVTFNLRFLGKAYDEN